MVHPARSHPGAPDAPVVPDVPDAPDLPERTDPTSRPAPAERPAPAGRPDPAEPLDASAPPDALPPAVDSMTLLVAAVIVHDKAAGRVLLLRRGPRAKFARGQWDLPIGKAEPGEAVTAAAVRELYEETGVTVRPDDLRLAHVVHSARGIEAPNGFLTVVFVTDMWTGEPVNREPGKHAEVRWSDAGAVPEPFVKTSGAALRHYLAGGPRVSLRGWE